MILVVNKGRSTHVITNVTQFEQKAVKVGFFHEDDVEAIDEAVIFFVGDRTVGGCVHVSQWDWVYILVPDICNDRKFNGYPMSNAKWIKRP